MINNRQNRKNLHGLPGNFSFLPQITDRTPKQFLDEILKIHENQYTPINNIPSILGRKIDLLSLYNAVAKRGGFKKMNTELSWEGVLVDLKMPVKCANASVALRSIFQRYLEPFERLQRNKATINDIEDELQMESDNRYKSPIQRTTLSHCNFHATSMVYRSDVHQISSHKRKEAGLSCDLTDVVEFNKLEMSLKSGLSNEIEFSLNTVLLMSFQADGVHLCHNHRLLDLILGTVGVRDFELLKDLSEHDRSTRKFLQFWNNIIFDEVGRRFLLPDIFVVDDFTTPEMEQLNFIFKMNDELTIYDREGQRVQLVVTIVRNLALDSTNSRIITQSHQCMRLIFLCCYASHFALRQLGLEILSMLSFPVVGILHETLKDFLENLIHSEDRVDRLRGLEILSHLSDQRVCGDNTEFLSGLPKHLFASLISMLIIHDLHIVVLALEALYAMSEVDSYLCTKLVHCSPETLSTLFILLSLEAQVMGTQSLIRIRVMQGPAMVTTCPPTNQTTLQRASIQQPQSIQTQLATSLMPPPPVPTPKIPASTISISHGIPSKPPISIFSEAQMSQNKPQITQKIYPLITRNNIIMHPPQFNGISHLSVPHTVKLEPTISSSMPQISPMVVTPTSQNPNTSLGTQLNTNKVLSVTSPNNQPPPPPLPSTIVTVKANHTVVTIAPCSQTLPMNNKVQNNQQSCISTVVTNAGSRNNVTLINKALTSTLSSLNDGENRNPLPEFQKPTSQAFTNKQDFVKSWLLNNYLESPQCTVPLFVMYKQLQVAVQNYFRDSEMVTAEEFHKLVRLLFTQVQLVQLNTAAGTVEIHYYNLKVSHKPSALDTLLESHPTKSNHISNSTMDTMGSVNNNSLPVMIGAQINYITASQKNNDPLLDQKQLKRPVSDLVNGHSNEDFTHLGQSSNKRPRLKNDIHETCHPENQHIHQNNLATYKSEEIHYSNGIVTSSYQKTQLSQLDERHCQSHSNAQTNHISNGTQVEELKHSDSETRAFSSSTVSPPHCESLANGTDGSSEGTMDSDLGRVVAIATMASTVSTQNQPPDTTIIKCQSPAVPVPDTFTGNKRTAKKNNLNQLGRTRSRFRTNNPGSKGKQRGSSSQRPHNLSYLYICEWDNCLQSFDKPQKVYGHVYTNHFMTLRTEVESACFWAGCNDTTRRTPLPLLNHVNEQHCNNVALESARQIRLAKEKEKSLPSPLTNNIVKQEPECAPKLLNFCPSSPQTPVSAASIQVPLVTTITLPHTCSITIHSSASVIPPSTLSSLSLACTEPMITSVLQTSISQSTVLPSTSIPQPNIESSPLPNQTDETSVSQPVPSRSPQIDTSQGSTTLPQTQSIPSSSTSQINPVHTANVQTEKIILKEGPVTKHIRFLSALILRNLCQCSSDARRFVAARHQQIFEMSISGCESSRVLSECLFYSSVENTGSPRKRK